METAKDYVLDRLADIVKALKYARGDESHFNLIAWKNEYNKIYGLLIDDNNKQTKMPRTQLLEFYKYLQDHITSVHAETAEKWVDNYLTFHLTEQEGETIKEDLMRNGITVKEAGKALKKVIDDLDQEKK